MEKRKSSSRLLHRALPIFLAAFGFSAWVRGSVIVNDVWSDGTRTDPTAANGYSENGTDTDTDGSIESAWYTSNAAGTTTTTGNMRLGTAASGSTSWTTYFTPEASPVTLANVGDQIKVTWVFTPTTITGTSTAQGLRLCVVDSPSASRVSTDTAPGTPAAGSQYQGYAMFGSMKTGNLGNGNSFQILKRADSTTTPNALLSASAAWAGIANGANTTTPGYTEAAQDTYVMTMTRNASNGIDIVSTMTGAGLGTGNQGFLTVSGTDAAPLGFTFDTFAVRPQTQADTAVNFDTSNFKVEFTPGVPEPASITLFGLAGALLVRRRRGA